MVYRSRQTMVCALLIMALAIPTVIISFDSSAYSNQYLFDEAEDIYYDTDLRSGLTLDSTNTRDIYRIKGLDSDRDKFISEDQLLTVGIIKDGGSNVRGTFFEPNGRPIGSMYSEGDRSEIELFVPYEGDYFLEVKADPEGSSAQYSFQLGGQENTNNEDYDGNNLPGSTGFSGGDLGGTLHPVNDVVDYIQFDLPPFFSVESILRTAADLKLDILNGTEDLIKVTGPYERYTIRNDEGEKKRLLFRIYYPIDGNELYSSSSPDYELDADVWSHTTIPEINSSDPWQDTIEIKEDHDLDPPLNLSTHFIESMGDELEFQITSENENIEISIMNHTVGRGDRAWNYSLLHISPKEDWAGEEIVSLKASDRDGEVTDSFTLNVREINDLPYITKVGNSVYEGGVVNIYGTEDRTRVYKMNFSDDDDPADNLFFTTNASDIISSFMELHPNGTMVLSPSQEDVGNYFFNITLEDGRGGKKVMDIAMAVEAVNDPPGKPDIEMIQGNMTLLPEETIKLKAIDVTDVDGDPLTIKWRWGDGRTSTGNPSSHTYSTSHSGNTTITLEVSDGFLVSKTNITIFVEAPEDVAVGDLMRDISDERKDCVKAQQEWNIKNEEERVFTVSTVGGTGIDILSIRTQRKGNALQVFLDMDGTIQIDGSFHYHLYVMKSGYQEPFFDFRNLSEWEEIPNRLPEGSMMITERKYVGDPFLHNESTGTIFKKATLLWTLPFKELVEGGLSYPIDPDDFEFFAVSIHRVDYSEVGVLAERYIITDTAGEGSLEVGKIKPQGNSTGSSSSSFGDFSEPTNLIVVVGIVVVLLILGITGFLLVRKQMKEKKEQEKEFIEHVKKLRSEGKDPFGNEVEEEGVEKKEASYESLYGTEKPDGYDEAKKEEPSKNLPGPGLGGPVARESHIEELKIENK